MLPYCHMTAVNVIMNLSNLGIVVYVPVVSALSSNSPADGFTTYSFRINNNNNKSTSPMLVLSTHTLSLSLVFISWIFQTVMSEKDLRAFVSIHNSMSPLDNGQKHGVFTNNSHWILSGGHI